MKYHMPQVVSLSTWFDKVCKHGHRPEGGLDVCGVGHHPASDCRNGMGVH